jgi:hypothetical protein
MEVTSSVIRNRDNKLLSYGQSKRMTAQSLSENKEKEKEDLHRKWKTHISPL